MNSETTHKRAPGRPPNEEASDKATPFDAAVGSRIKEAQAASAKFRTLKALADALEIRETTFRGYTSGSRRLPPDLALKVASLLSTTPEWLFYGRGPGPWEVSQPTGIRLAGIAAAGLLQTDQQLMPESPEFINIPSEFASIDGKDTFAVKLTTDDLDRRYPVGSILICTDIDTTYTPTDGDIVLVHRETAFGAERVFRLVRIVGAETWLYPDSNNPLHQAPWNFTKNDISGSILKIVALAISITHSLINTTK